MFINNFITRLAGDMGAHDIDFPVDDATLSVLRRVSFPITISSSLKAGNQDFEIVGYDKDPYNPRLRRGLEGTSVREKWPAGSYVYVSITAGTMNRLARPALDTEPSASSLISKWADIYSPLTYYYTEEVAAVIVTQGALYDENQNYLGQQPVVWITRDGGKSFISVHSERADYSVISVSGGSLWPDNVAILMADESGSSAELMVVDMTAAKVISRSVFRVGVDIAELPVYASFKDGDGLYTSTEFYSLSRDRDTYEYTISYSENLNFTFEKLEEKYLFGSYYGLYGYNQNGDVLGVYQSGGSVIEEADPGTNFVASIQHPNHKVVFIRSDGMAIGSSQTPIWTPSGSWEKITSACGAHYENRSGGYSPGFAVGTSSGEVLTFNMDGERIGRVKDKDGNPVWSLRFTGNGFIWRNGESQGNVITGLIDGFQDGYMPGRVLRNIMSRLEALEEQP